MKVSKTDPKILVLVYNPYDGIMGGRARGLFGFFPKKINIDLVYRVSNNLIDTIRFLFLSLFKRPDIIYMMDVGLPSFVAAFFAKYLNFKKVKIFLDTGDLVSVFSSEEKKRNFLIEKIIYYTEQFSWNISDEIVVRGSYFKSYMEKKGYDNVHLIYDGVHSEVFKPINPVKLRKKLGLEGVTTVGTMGNLFWISKWQWCYGWYLVNALPYLKDKNIKAVIIGKGEGLGKLKQRAKELGVEDKIIFTGRVAEEEFVDYLNLIDLFIFTQPHHLQTSIRVCAKLPQILATGRFIISSDIEEPMKVIDKNGEILHFDGLIDKGYPKRLAESIKSYIGKKNLIKRGNYGVKIAKDKFDYKVLSKKLQKIVLGG